MTQHQTQSHFSRVPSKEPQSAEASQDASLSRPRSPDATSPYEGPEDHEQPSHKPAHVTHETSPAEMAEPYFSEAQSTLGAFSPVQRPGDPFPEPEDPQTPRAAAPTRSEQPHGNSARVPDPDAAFQTTAGTIRAGMTVLDSYGHAIGIVSGVDGERLRLASTDPHDDGVAFLPVSLIDGIEEDRVLLGGRGDSSFGVEGH
ncbi:DUF2171 domain-containing protein [Novosphingobium sp. M1R2S20]|uniref:DUF2171 domain-containing protein n=1 Tax=Novosphingobium rhizovicinum TaxID=3228928 RepID=A0ABV3RA69_9SPHN